jgi:hypothetical protein
VLISQQLIKLGEVLNYTPQYYLRTLNRKFVVVPITKDAITLESKVFIITGVMFPLGKICEPISTRTIKKDIK